MVAAGAVTFNDALSFYNTVTFTLMDWLEVDTPSLSYHDLNYNNESINGREIYAALWQIKPKQ